MSADRPTPGDRHRSPQGGGGLVRATLRHRCAAGLLMLGTLLPAHALDLLEAYGLAVAHDPTLRAAAASREAGQEAQTIGRAGLLPQVSLTYSNSPRNRQDARVTETDIFGNVQENSQQRDYTSYTGSLVLRQALYDPAALARYRQGQAQALLADAQWQGQAQAMAVRLGKAYTDALQAREQLLLAEAQRRAYTEQLARNTQAFRHGDGTRTDMAETSARLGLAQAQEIEATDTLDVAERALEAIVGVPLASVGALHGLAPDFRPPAETLPFDAWRAQALADNAELAAQRQTLAIAEQEIRRQAAGHLPRAELFAMHSQNRSDIASTYNQRYRTDSIGVQFVVPLYAGGSVSAAARQAAQQRESARYLLEAKTADLLVDLRRQWRLSASGPERIAAQAEAVASAEAALEGTRRSVEGGERINLDVLNAEQQLYAARRDLARARHDLLLARLTLRQRAGALTETDLAELNHFFTRPLPPAAGATAAASITSTTSITHPRREIQ